MFEEILKSVELEDLGPGRKGAVLCRDHRFQRVFMRSTAKFQKPAQSFTPLHYALSYGLNANYAIVEVYEASYRRMRFHTDAALDLVPCSDIGIYTCYEDPTDIRQLILRKKNTKQVECFNLNHHQLFILNYMTNAMCAHKVTGNKASKCIVITFYQSKNYKAMRLATKEETQQFYDYKFLENTQNGFVYPPLDYTLSPGDMVVNPLLE